MTMNFAGALGRVQLSILWKDGASIHLEIVIVVTAPAPLMTGWVGPGVLLEELSRG